MTQTQWADLAHEAAVRAATELLELGSGFDDPLLAAWHLADFTAPIGPDTYLEILAPTAPDHSMTRWLSRVGGASGWVLSIQVPSLDGVNERAAEHGVRIAVQAQAQGRRIVQFHPLDKGAGPVQVTTGLGGDHNATWSPDGKWIAFSTQLDPKLFDYATKHIAVVPAAGGPAGGRTGIVAVDLHATDREHGVGLAGELCHTLIRFV